MKRLTLEATDENILNSIKDNTYYRNPDVKDFIEALGEIEGNMFISLDARWGEGKTFYVRQIEKTLEYVTKKMTGEEKDQNEKVRFLNGESNILETLCKEIKAIHFMLCRLDGSGNDENEKFDIGFEKIMAVYNYTFKMKPDELEENRLETLVEIEYLK